MLGDILRKCRHALDYHSNESVLMSFNRLHIEGAGKEESAFSQRRPESDGEKQWLITQNGKKREKHSSFVVQWLVTGVNMAFRGRPDVR